MPAAAVLLVVRGISRLRLRFGSLLMAMMHLAGSGSRRRALRGIPARALSHAGTHRMRVLGYHIGLRRTRRTKQHEMRTLMEIIGLIVAGIIIGLLGKLIAPGDKDNIPIWLTIVCGVGGVLIGRLIYGAFGGDGSDGVDWVRWLVAIVTAAVLVIIASTVTGRSKTRI